MEPIKTVVQELESKTLVRFQDCDPFGHLNNARYIDYFLNARQDQIQLHYGLRIYQPGMQASWVVRKTQIAYVRPVQSMEEILIRTRLLYFDESSLIVEGRMFDAQGRHLKALVWFDFVYISLSTGRPERHSDDLLGLFRAAALNDDYEPNGFNRRVEALRRQGRKPLEASAAA